VREMVSPVGDVWCVLNRPLEDVILNLEQRLVRKTDLGRRLFAKLQAHHFGTGCNQPTFHGLTQKKAAGGFGVSNVSEMATRCQTFFFASIHQGQPISQIDAPAVVIEHVFDVLSWVAIACQLGGGPALVVAVMVTPTVGTKPCAAPLPEK